MKLEIKNLKKSYGTSEAIKKIALSIDTFKVLALVGPSGSGKTTLLRLLAGLETIDTGSIALNGEKIPQEERRLREYRKKIGFVFQSYNLFPHLTLIENIALPLYCVHKYSKMEARERARELLHIFELSKHLEKRPAELSGGQSQRAAIVRAISVKRDLLLFDEPTSALDPCMTGEIQEIIAHLEGRLIIASHHIPFLERVADWVVFMSEGKVIESCSKQDFFTSKHPETKRFLSFC